MLSCRKMCIRDRNTRLQMPQCVCEMLFTHLVHRYLERTVRERPLAVVEPVSYTHLDVYKRQRVYSITLVFFKNVSVDNGEKNLAVPEVGRT